MTLIAKLLLGGKWIVGAIGRAFGWLLEKPIRGVLALLILVVATHQFVIDPRLRAARDAALARADEAAIALFNERQAHRQTKFDYRAAQADAAKLEAARLARVKAEQQEITDEVAEDFRRRLADARTRAGELRRATDARAHAGGASGGERLPAAGDAARRADEAPREDGFPLEERLIATEQAIQLDALIGWVERQAKVPVNDAAVAR